MENIEIKGFLDFKVIWKYGKWENVWENGRKIWKLVASWKFFFPHCSCIFHANREFWWKIQQIFLINCDNWKTSSLSMFKFTKCKLDVNLEIKENLIIKPTKLKLFDNWNSLSKSLYRKFWMKIACLFGHIFQFTIQVMRTINI